VSDDVGFRWRARFWHLTYRGHVPPELLLLQLSSLTSIRALGTSIVHESSDEEAPYEHTHMAWLPSLLNMLFALRTSVTVRCFVSTKTLRPEDYPDELRKEYGLDQLEKLHLPDGTCLATSLTTLS
jgi:hypothetical protein